MVEKVSVMQETTAKYREQSKSRKIGWRPSNQLEHRPWNAPFKFKYE